MSDLRPLDGPPIRDFPGLHEALRRRQAELAVSHETVAAISGVSWVGKAFQPLAGFGHVDPNTGRCAGRTLSLVSLGPVLQSLGMCLVAHEDVAATERLKSRSDWMPRNERYVTAKMMSLHDLVEQRARQLIAERGVAIDVGYRG
jgi:hypothetical protein